MTPHNFQTDLAASLKETDRFDDYYRRTYGHKIVITRFMEDCTQQRQGIDAIIHLPSGKQILVDEKTRKTDYGDILLEEWSNYESRKVGWTLDLSKWTDNVAYATPKTIYYLPYDLLRRTALTYWQEWTRTYFYPVDSLNEGYTTRNIGVPYLDLVRYMAGTMREAFTTYPC